MRILKSKAFKVIGAILALYALISLAGPLFTKPAAAMPYYTNPRPPTMVIAHQGGDGVWPGNTLYAFEKAAEIGAHVLEMDAHITRDGHIVLIHDETVDRTTNGAGEVEAMTLEELQRLDAAHNWTPDNGQTHPYRGMGITIPSLAAVFERFPDMRHTIELKKTRASMAQPLCDLIRKYAMQDKVLVASFHDAALAEFRQTCPEVATSASRGEATPFVLLGKVFLGGWVSPQYQSLQVPWNPKDSLNIPIMTARFIREAHAKGIAVEPWTVDDPELMRQYIAWGVDGIITDRPDIMVALLGEQ